MARWSPMCESDSEIAFVVHVSVVFVFTITFIPRFVFGQYVTIYQISLLYDKQSVKCLQNGFAIEWMMPTKHLIK